MEKFSRLLNPPRIKREIRETQMIYRFADLQIYVETNRENQPIHAQPEELHLVKIEAPLTHALEEEIIKYMEIDYKLNVTLPNKDEYLVLQVYGKKLEKR